MAYSRPEEGNLQDGPGASYNARGKEVIKKHNDGTMSEIKEPTKRVLNGQNCNDFRATK